MRLYFVNLAAPARGDAAAVAAIHAKLTDDIVFGFEQVLELQVSMGQGRQHCSRGLPWQHGAAAWRPEQADGHPGGERGLAFGRDPVSCAAAPCRSP
eukprot:1903152-Pyramimonas_sp.AAC.1